MRRFRFYILWCVAVFSGFISRGQSFMGNYNGDNTIGVIANSPGLAVTDDRGQVSIGALGVNGGGNYLLFNRSAFGFLTTGLETPGTDYVKNPEGATKTLWLNMELQGPGVSVKILKRHVLSLTTGVRYLVNSSNLGNDVFMQLGSTGVRDTLAHDTFNIHNYFFTSQIFKEYNLSYSTYLRDNENYMLAAGVTVKLLVGMGAVGVGVPQAGFATNNGDGIAYGLTGTAHINFTPYANRYALFNSPLNAIKNSMNNLGLGFSVGGVYYIHVNNSFSRKKAYQARFALSVSDIGKINYSASSTSGNYMVSGQNVNYRAITNNPAESFGNRIFNEYLLNTVAQATSSSSKFSVHLPTALRFNADINMSEERFYVNADAIVNLIKPSADKFTNYYITTFCVTPRYYITPEKDIAFGMPFTYNVMGQGTLGAVAYVGPFFIGSRSFFNMFIDNMFNNIDIYTGLNFRIKPKHEKEKDYMMM